MLSWIRRYRERLGDEREYVSGRYHVTLHRGPFRSEVTVRKDVWPALGGVIAHKVARDCEAERIYEAAVREMADRPSGSDGT